MFLQNFVQLEFHYFCHQIFIKIKASLYVSSTQDNLIRYTLEASFMIN